MHADMLPEHQLCLLLLRGEFSPAVQKQALELLDAPLRWPLLLRDARRYQILPLLYRNLKTLDFPGIPDDTRSELANAFQVNAIRNQLFARELARILRLLGDARIPVMPLKGLALAESLYEDPALRVCADIDILVPTKNVVDAFHLIVSSGYRSEFAHSSLLDLVARYGKDCVLMREDSICTYPLELHCGLMWGGLLERNLLDEIWAQADRKAFCGVPAWALSPSWEFLYLAVHAARHGWLSLKWFVDLDRLCSRKTINWQSVKEKAQLLGWEDAVRSSLSACASLFGTQINPVLCATEPPRRYRLPLSSDFQVPSEILFSIRLVKGPSRRLRFVAIRLFIPTIADCEFLPLPSSLFFLYYLLRPLRLACKTIGWFIQAELKSVRHFLRTSTE